MENILMEKLDFKRIKIGDVVMYYYDSGLRQIVQECIERVLSEGPSNLDGAEEWYESIKSINDLVSSDKSDLEKVIECIDRAKMTPVGYNSDIYILDLTDDMVCREGGYSDGLDDVIRGLSDYQVIFEYVSHEEKLLSFAMDCYLEKH